ncbi:MAG: 23S rRNA (pseudouridine(1915)-N(3))-methyltransferase RlmH [Saprospiraceae bacterium]|nr:23S rRNA (pseudouridine(1915)-N(3))-methyltransferase RlmH [Saprospiraceae bacterium]
MKVIFRVVGKTNEAYLQSGIDIYKKRLGHYLPFAMEVIPDLRKVGNLNPSQVKQKEGEAILKQLGPNDMLILLDEEGQTYSSEKFALWMDKRLQQPAAKIIFQVGGAFGFSSAVYDRSQFKLSLSDMTFSHQMIRLFFLEQLYRAMTILRNEPYHNR